MKLRYKPIRQKPYCCVPACLSMILEKRGFKITRQEEIGYNLGLIVPKEKAHLFKKIRTGKKPKAGWGTRINLKKYSLNNFFRKNKLKLKYKYYFPKQIKDIPNFIGNNLSKNNDIIVCFNYRNLYDKGNDGGHVSLINNLEKSNITLIDPHNKGAQIRKVNLEELIGSMIFHGRDKSGGFWVISKIN